MSSLTLWPPEPKMFTESVFFHVWVIIDKYFWPARTIEYVENNSYFSSLFSFHFIYCYYTCIHVCDRGYNHVTCVWRSEDRLIIAHVYTCMMERGYNYSTCGDQRAALIIACVYTCMMERGYTTPHVWRLEDSSYYCTCIYVYGGERLQPHHVCGDRRTALWSQFLPSIFIWAPGIELRSEARPFTSPQPVLPWGSTDATHAFSYIFTCHVICSPFPDSALSVPWNWL